MADWIIAPEEDYVDVNAKHGTRAQVQISEPAPDIGAEDAVPRRSKRQRKQKAGSGVAVVNGPAEATRQKRKGGPKTRASRLENDDDPSAGAAPEADEAVVSKVCTSQSSEKPKPRKKGSRGTKKATRGETMSSKTTATTVQPFQASNSQQEDKQPDLEQKFKCPICLATLAHVNSAREHYRNRHLGEAHVCPVCGRALVRHSTLRNHMQNMHEGHDVPPPRVPTKLPTSMFLVA
ncbi:hypothetical protein EVG20_g11704 [Dentipellis fragilis]|uniref:C2H2-type domain-containing protein n=1 Tax=Dentipellis fragilis TaxID=205917 RepID=A0A4Y9XJP5_9AGAM|nr:hypothetical protein EVG20_g11704 [Dentipellis fragilis]